MRIMHPAVLAALFAAFFSLLLPGCVFLTQPPQENATNSTHDYRIYGDPSVFFDSMSKSRDFSIIMDITDAQGDKNQYVFLCGTGIVASWVELGKNISHLTNYVIDGDSCIKGVPTLNETINTTTQACREEFIQYPYAQVSYGQPESYFSNSSWNMIVDEEYMKRSECGFSQSQPTE